MSSARHSLLISAIRPFICQASSGAKPLTEVSARGLTLDRQLSVRRAIAPPRWSGQVKVRKKCVSGCECTCLNRNDQAAADVDRANSDGYVLCVSLCSGLCQMHGSKGRCEAPRSEPGAECSLVPERRSAFAFVGGCRNQPEMGHRSALSILR